MTPTVVHKSATEFHLTLPQFLNGIFLKAIQSDMPVPMMRIRQSCNNARQQCRPSPEGFPCENAVMPHAERGWVRL